MVVLGILVIITESLALAPFILFMKIARKLINKNKLIEHRHFRITRLLL